MAGCKPIHVDVEVDVANPESGVRAILQRIRPDWKAQEIQITDISGGFLNKLVGCHLASDPERRDCIVNKIYGRDNACLRSNEPERIAMQILGSLGACAKLHASFNNGISYEFIPGETLNFDTVKDPDMQRLIAKAIAQVHRTDLSLFPQTGDVRFIPGVCSFTEYTRALFSKLPDGPEGYKHPHDRARYEKEGRPKAELQADFERLVAHVDGLGCPVRFCHNDLNPANIIINQHRDQIRFIDFEFGTFNYVAHDLAAHFLFWAGIVDADFTKCPDRETMSSWIRTYLQFYQEADGKDPASVTDRDVEILYVQVQKFSLLALFGIGLGCLVQPNFTTRDTDFMEIGLRFHKEYYTRRDKVLALPLPE